MQGVIQRDVDMTKGIVLNEGVLNDGVVYEVTIKREKKSSRQLISQINVENGKRLLRRLCCIRVRRMKVLVDKNHGVNSRLCLFCMAYSIRIHAKQCKKQNLIDVKKRSRRKS